MYFDAAVDVVKGKGDRAHTAILALSTLAISPLGYLLTRWLGGLADSADAALFLAA